MDDFLHIDSIDDNEISGNYIKKLIIIVGIIILIFFTIIFVVYKISEHKTSSKYIKSVKVNDSDINFSDEKKDYYFLVEEDKISIDCDIKKDINIEGCNTKIDLSNYSRYIHQITYKEKNNTYIYKLNFKKKENDSEQLISIDKIDGLPTEWTSGNVMIDVKTKSKNEIVEYSFDNGESFQQSSLYKISENKVLDIIAKDEYGNTSTTTRVDVDKIDNVNPKGIIIKESSSDEIQLIVKAKDDESGIAEYSWNGEKFSKKTTYKVKEKGTYHVDIKDKAGNIERVSINIKDSDFVNRKQYSVTLMKNGADQIDNDFLVCTNENCKVNLPNIYRLNSEIIGWSTKKNATKAEYKVGEKISLKKDLKLYAITKRKINIEFNSNELVNISSHKESCTLNNSDTYCYVKAPSITYSDGKIIGWNNVKESDNALATPNNLIRVSSDESFFALVYKAIEITYDKNTATSISKEKEYCHADLETGGCIIKLPTIKKNGGRGLGWSTNKNSKTADYGQEEEIEVYEKTTFYAITKKEYSVKFEKNGSDSLSDKELTCEINGSSSSCIVTAPYINRSSSEIIGFSKDKDSHTADIKPGDDIVVNGNITYYAITKKNVTIKFDSNGSDYALSTKTCSYYNNDKKCKIETPDIVRTGFEVHGWSTSKTDHKGTYAALEKIEVSSNKTFYAITSKKVTVTYIRNGLDELKNCTTKTSDGCKETCTIYNSATTCSVKVPYLYSKGNEVQSYSTTSNSQVTTSYSPSKKLSVSNNLKLYAITYNKYRKQTFSIAKVKNYGFTAIEADSTCPSSTYNNYYNFLDKAYYKVPYLFSASKLTMVGNNNFLNTWGSFAGMTYGSVDGYRNVDVRCPESFSTYYYHTLIHELTHSWDSMFKAKTGTALKQKSDVKALLEKYKNRSTRPLRAYSYENEAEFIADMYAWYYFLYIDSSERPTVVKNNTYYPSDMKSVMEKYINIAKRGYN